MYQQPGYQQPGYQQAMAPGINSAGDALAWPFRDPQWLSKILLQGLINIIPIIGQMALFGWLYGSLDNLRQGRQELQGAGFGNFGRGAALWLVNLIYQVVIFVVYALLLVPAGGIANRNAAAASAGAALFSLLAGLWQLAAGIVLGLIFPTIVLFVDRGGIGRGLNVVAVLQLAFANAGVALLVGLFSIIATIIGGLGVILCFIGLAFTTVWTAGAQAGLVYWMERNLPGGGGMMPQPPPPAGYMQQPPPPPPPAPPTG
jgi:hypothetical protein